MRADRTRLPDIGPPPPFRFSRVHKDRLPNQLSLWSAEHRSLPVVTFMVVLPVGSAADFEGYEGLAAITADMIDEGTGNLTAIDVIVTKNMRNSVTLFTSFTRQWHDISGDWNPTDPAE